MPEKTYNGAVQAHAHKNRGADRNNGHIGGPISHRKCRVTGLETQGGPQSQRHHHRIRTNRDDPFKRPRHFYGLPCKVASRFHGL